MFILMQLQYYSEVFLTLLLIPKGTVKGIVCLTTMVQQEPQSQMSSQAYANYAVGLPEVRSHFDS